jgi:hypothetical protein
MIKIPELDIEVEDVSDFNDEASEILEAFCIDLSKKDGMCRPAGPMQDLFLAETCFTHIWMNGASKLIETERTRLHLIGEKYFGQNNLELDIETSWFREP